MSNDGEKSGSKLGTFFSKAGGAAVKFGKVAVAGIATASTAIGGVTVKALSSAGELEQNMGGSEAVFGEYANKMQNTSKTAFSNMGLSASDFLATANKMGALFQGAGFGIEESATLSADSMQRAADVASIMGIDTASAMEAVAGAAKGNFTMMDNLGVAMNDTTLNAYALEKGIGKTTQEMTNQEKIGLAMDLFMEKTAYATGNYAKENETLAGSLGTAKAALSNFLSGAGSVDDVVSSFSSFGDVVVKNLGEMFPKLMTGMSQITQQLIPKIPGLLNQILPSLIQGATGLLVGLASAAPQILSVFTTSVLPQLVTATNEIFSQILTILPSLIESVVSAFPTLIPLLISGLVNMAVLLCSNFAQIIQPIIDYLPQTIVSLVTALVQNLPILISGIGQLVVGVIRAIPQLLSALWQSITTLASNFATTLFGKIEGWIRQLFPKSADTVLKILTTIKDYFSMLVSNIGQILSVVVSVISTPFKLAWNGVKLIWDNCVAYFRLIWDNIKAIFSVVDSVLSGDFEGAWNGIKQIWSNCVGFFKTIVSNVKNAFANVGEILAAPFRKGRDAVKNIVDNIKGFFTGLKLKFPNIPLPHFGLSPSGWKIGDLLKGSIPRLSIDWYAKAMDKPMLMERPTIFGYDASTGQLMGGGEAGSEVVSGTNTLLNMIQGAVANETNVLAYYLERLLEMLADYFPQIIEAAGHDIYLNKRKFAYEMADDMNTALGRLTAQKGRGR